MGIQSLKRIYDSNMPTRGNPYWRKWQNIFDRLRADKTYQDCSICDAWLTYSNFEAWMETKDWHGKELDKDILIPGNKIYYPDACCFVSKELNTVFKPQRKGKYLQGVSKWSDISWEARCGGYYRTELAANHAYAASKVKRLMELMKQESDPSVRMAVRKQIARLVECIKNGTPAEFYYG